MLGHWEADEIALLGLWPDGEIARRIDRSVSAVRNKHRQWKINPAELHRVYGPAPVATTSRIDELIAKLRTRQEREQSQRPLPTAQQGKPSRLRRVWRWMQAAG